MHIGSLLLYNTYATISMLCFFFGASLPFSANNKKPNSKRELSIWRLECELGVISDPECPVDGGWAPWGPWSICHGLCDDVGHRNRKRVCNNPTPSEDGMPCSGRDEQFETCYITNCTVENYRKLVEGDSARMEALRQLEAVPALMERCLETECPYEAIGAALATDNTWQLNPEALWNSLQCVKRNMGCPVVGEWGPWGEWSACGSRCGQGIKWKLRRCDTPPPSDALLFCSGSPLQTEICEGDQCAIYNRNSESSGTWSAWGTWTECSEICGPGVKRRRRYCNEKYALNESGVWGTHCRGQHDQLELCQRDQCVLNGDWSGWGVWGPCSQNCGAGKRSRTRSCTRPIPSGGGTSCVGPRTEVGSCYLNPCDVYSHTVAVFNGESFLHYNFEKKRSTLFHFYIRFNPFSPHGTLVRRGSVHNPLIRLSLQKWHLCLDASGSSFSCTLPRICSQAVIEPAVWHTALIAVTNEGATLRVDDAQVPIKTSFTCNPELPDDPMEIHIGERFRGEIQEAILNFIPLNLILERKTKSDFYPTVAMNVAHNEANIDEAYLHLEGDEYLRVPCFDQQDEWRLELTLKPKRDAGTLLFLNNKFLNAWLYLILLNGRLKMKLADKGLRSESSSSTECPQDQWLDVTLSKKSESNAIEASINSGERLHVLLEENYDRKRRSFTATSKISETVEEADSYACGQHTVTICHDEFFVGGIPSSYKTDISEELTSFYGTIASLSINSVLQDLHELNSERFRDGAVQVSSRSASISGSYHETAWGLSGSLNLTCLHTRSMRSPSTAQWLFLDTTLFGILRQKPLRCVDDGRILRLVASADNDLRGFYTCRAHGNKQTRNVVTYGVVGNFSYKFKGPERLTFVAVVTTVTLVVGSLIWLIIEGIFDLQDGYGFYRDANLAPHEEAEAVCRYIDQNIDLVGSKSAAKVAKTKARRKAKEQVSRPFDKDNIVEIVDNEETTMSEPEYLLPALPEIRSTSAETSHNDKRNTKLPYLSTPCQESFPNSPRFRSSISLDETSPRVICSRLVLSKYFRSPRNSVSSTKSLSSRFASRSPRVVRSNLLTIKSSTILNQSPVQKILQKFKNLRSLD